MERKTIQINKDDYEFLKEMKKRTGKNIYFLVHELIENYKKLNSTQRTKND